MTTPDHVPSSRRERLAAALRTRRIQVSIALMLAAAICAGLAAYASGEELGGAYEDGGRRTLRAVGESFTSDLRPADLSNPAALGGAIDRAVALDDNIDRVAVYERRGARVVPVAASDPAPVSPAVIPQLRRTAVTGREHNTEIETETEHHELLMLPLLDGGRPIGAAELTYDMKPYDELVSTRTRDMALVLAILLAGFSLFTAFVLGRGIFRPLHRLRLATHRIREGELHSRLNWRRRDELGLLARDFDDMAAELEDNHRRLEALALEDPLTGLANHRHFQEVLADEVEVARRTGTTVALVLLDLDHFKQLNDVRGHPFGDETMRTIGRQLKSTLRGLGLAARVGGDEFALVLADADGARAYALCEAARATVGAMSPQGYELSVSAGLALFPDDAGDAATLVQVADGALYWAKRSGRGRTRRYDPEHVMVVTDEQRAEFSAMLEQPKAVRPVFQPIVALSSGRIVGYEALARFANQRGRLPTWWFAQAHKFGLGHQLEAEAVRVAVATEGRPRDAWLAVNLSPSAVVSRELGDVLDGDLHGLVIEVTEQERIGDDERTREVLNNLRARGARIAVDDTGAGYAGLQTVMSLRADIIKLDRALVADVDRDRAKRALVEAFVSFARNTGAEVCAEGIENLQALDVLREIGVSYGQGYALARPGPAWPALDPQAVATCWPGLASGRGRLTAVADERSVGRGDSA